MRFCILILGSLSLLSYLQITSGILCFTCKYEEEFQTSSLCEEKPSNADLQQYSDATLLGPAPNNSSVEATSRYYCVTIKGDRVNSTNKGVKYVRRGATKMETYKGEKFCDVKPPEDMAETNLKNITTCYCNKDRCNTDAANTGTGGDGDGDGGGDGANSIGPNAIVAIIAFAAFIPRFIS